jgi:hypothetical protein
MMRRFLILPLLLLIAAPAAHAALRAWVDNPQVAPGDTVQLTLAHDGQTRTEPDLTPLKQDFDIVSRSTSTSVQIANGSASSSTQLILTLTPKRSGPLMIPAITWDADRSTPVAINVGSSAAGQSGAGAPASRVFLETEVDPKSPYIQAAVHVTVRIFIAVPLSHANLDFPTTDTAVVRQAGGDENGSTVRNGQTYQVVVRHYVLIPQHSGHLIIPGPVLTGETLVNTQQPNINDPFAGFFSNSPFGGMLAARKPIRINSAAIVLDAQPRPAGAGSSYWLPAQNVSLTAQWNPSQPRVNVGDPATVTLHLQAVDATSAELPDLSTLLRLPPGIKAYPDEPKLKDSDQSDTVIGQRDQSVALIADQPGHFTIPELRLSWWDTRTNQAREAVLPEQTLVVAPAPGSPDSSPATASTDNSPARIAPAGGNSGNTTAAQTPPPTSTAGESKSLGTPRNVIPWHWISLALGLLWLGTLIAWLSTRKRGAGPGAPTLQPVASHGADKSRARSEFQAACRANDALGARRNLLLWANALSPEERIIGLSALGKRVEDPAVTGLLRDLDRACYVGGSWDGAALAAALQELTLPGREKTRKKPELAPLYR